MSHIKLFENFREQVSDKGIKKMIFGKESLTKDNLIGGYSIEEMNDENEFSFSLTDWQGKPLKGFDYAGDNWIVTEANRKESADSKYSHEFGYIVLKNGQLQYVISIYEPHGFGVNENKGVITVYGHEEIVNLWLEDGDNDRYHTR
jgi:hypothetical protein